jgi:hypothetical protein
MENETWMNARKAVELGFADEILFADGKAEAMEAEGGESDGKEVEAVWQPFSTRVMGQTILNRLVGSAETLAPADEVPAEIEGKPQDMETSAAGLTDMFEEAIGETEPDADMPPDEENVAEPAEDTDTPSAENPSTDTADEVGVPPSVENATPKVPVIGMDGKTPDGAMPYELLRKQLDFLK